MIRNCFWVLLLLLCFACDRSRKERRATPPIVKELPHSRANIEINFPVADLEAGINSVLQTELLNEALPLQKEGDTLYLKIRKNNKLNLAVKGLTAYASIPLEIEVAIRQKVLGIAFNNQDSPVKFGGTAKAKTDFDIDDDWSLSLDCSWIGMELSSTPTLQVMGFKIDVEDIVNKQLKKHEADISNAICTALHQTVDFRSMMTKVWADIQNPIRISKKPAELWLQIDPISLGANMVPKDDTISLLTTFVSEFQVSPVQSNETKKQLPVKGVAESGASYLLSYIDARVPYDQMSGILKTQLGRLPIEVEGYTAVIKDVTISATEDQQLAISLQLEGDYTGGVEVIGRPHLSDKYVLSIDDFDFKLSPEGELAEVADWMLEEFISAYISQYLEFDLSTQFGKLDSLANAGVRKAPIGQKLDFNFQFLAMKPYYLDIGEKEMSWVMTLDGKSTIQLKSGIFDKKN